MEAARMSALRSSRIKINSSAIAIKSSPSRRVIPRNQYVQAFEEDRVDPEEVAGQ
jgi:hypothetical protein